MPDHHHVNAHGLEIPGGVYQGLSLRNARTSRGDIDGVRRQPLLGKLEGNSRARGVLEEEIDDRRAPERGHFLDRSLAYLLERFSGVENETNLVASERLEVE